MSRAIELTSDPMQLSFPQELHHVGGSLRECLRLRAVRRAGDLRGNLAVRVRLTDHFDRGFDTVSNKVWDNMNKGVCGFHWIRTWRGDTG